MSYKSWLPALVLTAVLFPAVGHAQYYDDVYDRYGAPDYDNQLGWYESDPWDLYYSDYHFDDESYMNAIQEWEEEDLNAGYSPYFDDEPWPGPAGYFDSAPWEFQEEGEQIDPDYYGEGFYDSLEGGFISPYDPY